VSLGDVRGDARDEVVGFYNTFVGRPGGSLPTGVGVWADPVTGDIHMVAGPHFRGVQFHAESILTENGFSLLRDLVLDLLAP
jgi:phenazine biosynthesis protein phzE